MSKSVLCGHSIPFPPLAYTASQIPQGVNSRVPINASICYTNAPLQARKASAWYHFLVAGKQIRLDHDTDYAILTGT